MAGRFHRAQTYEHCRRTVSRRVLYAILLQPEGPLLRLRLAVLFSPLERGAPPLNDPLSARTLNDTGHLLYEKLFL